MKTFAARHPFWFIAALLTIPWLLAAALVIAALCAVLLVIDVACGRW